VRYGTPTPALAEAVLFILGRVRDYARLVAELKRPLIE